MCAWKQNGEQKIDEYRFFQWCRDHIRGFKIDGEHSAKGFCPFHKDNSPSLRMWGNSGIFNCRGACAEKAPKDKNYMSWNYWNFCKALGVLPDYSILLESAKYSAPKDNDSKYYTYTNERGAGIFRVCKKRDGQRFCQYSNGSRWINGSNGLRPIYNKHLLLNADAGLTCIIVEGEKDAENLTELGFLATTTPFGAAHDLTAFRAEFPIILRFRRIVIIPDNDPPGHHYKDSVIDLLYSLGGKETANKIKVLDIAKIAGVETKGFDVSDYIDLLRNAGIDPKTKIGQLLAQLP